MVEQTQPVTVDMVPAVPVPVAARRFAFVSVAGDGVRGGVSVRFTEPQLRAIYDFMRESLSVEDDPARASELLEGALAGLAVLLTPLAPVQADGTPVKRRRGRPKLNKSGT